VHVYLKCKFILPRLRLICLAPYFVVMIIVYIIDLFVLVPLTVWSIQAAVAMCKGGTSRGRRLLAGYLQEHTNPASIGNDQVHLYRH